MLRFSDLKHGVFFALLFLTGGSICLPADAAEPGKDYLVFGFLPVVSTERLVRRFSPLVDYLSAQLGIPVRLETAPDFGEFIRRTGEKGRYDILFTAPHLYYLASKEYGYHALVRVDRPGMRAVIVVPLHSDIHRVEDLHGKRLATVDHLALATVLVTQRLQQAGLDAEHDLSLIETPSHNASLLSTYQGRTDASGLILPVYLRAESKILESTRIIAETEVSPHMPISVAPWLDPKLSRRIGNALLDLPRTEQGRAVLRVSGWPGFTPVKPGDYDGIQWMADQVRERK